MGQKRVTLKVAKAIKEAGYPLTKVVCGKYDGHTPVMYAEPINEENWADCDSWYLPTYLEVWLWLWREKKACISILFDEGNCGIEIWNKQTFLRDFESTFDPEEAIIAAIEYIVDNNLLK